MKKVPQFQPQPMIDGGGFELSKKEGGRGNFVIDGDWKRSNMKKNDESDSSSSVDVETIQLKE